VADNAGTLYFEIMFKKGKAEDIKAIAELFRSLFGKELPNLLDGDCESEEEKG